MALSIDSDTWSESANSYFSTEETDSLICPTPRSLREFLADKLREMRCMKRNEHEAASTEEVDAMDEYPGRYMSHYQVSSSLKEKLERLHAEGDAANAKRYEPSVKQVSFFEPPIYRPQMTEQMDVDAASISRDFLDLTSLSAMGSAGLVIGSAGLAIGSAGLTFGRDVLEIRKNVDLSKLLEEPSIFSLNIPELNSLVESSSKKEVGGNKKPVQLEYQIGEGQGTSAQEIAEDNEENMSPSTNNKKNEQREKNMSTAKRFVERLFEMITARSPVDQEERKVDMNETNEKGS